MEMVVGSDGDQSFRDLGWGVHDKAGKSDEVLI